MANEWTSRPLRDCATWFSGGTPSKGNPNYWNGSIPWISAKSLTGFFISDSEDKVTEAGSVNGTRLVPANTILFIVRGMSLKSEFRMGITTRPVTFNQDLKALIAHDDILPAFLAYSIKGRTQEILGLVGEAGHGTGVLPTDRIQRLEISVPPLEEQRAIVHVLGTLDDKIELNRKQNETLEAMASALFKAWFVDFEPVRAKQEGRWQRGQSLPGLPAQLYDLFPNRLVESELGVIPEGWGIGSLSDAVEIIGGGTPKTSVNEYWDGEIPWFSVVDTPASSDVFVVKTEKSITQAGLDGSSARLISKGTTIITARGTVGNLAIAGCDMTFNQSCYALKGSNGSGCYFVFLSAQHMVEQLKAMAHGSVFSTITRQTFEAVRAVLPPENVLQQFEKISAGLLDPILGNVNESCSLSQLRDTLLPKLISGELRVPDAERIVGATV
ncbi:restriction endonuclease subunit S [Pseudomonas alvandae]|uniref:restriction endonuclease subunit S n=1 Tax=Pseudomonas canavaninivorans TaxID=2842348 RepID=UPI00215FF026|nr:restriction endonuclease subunit S [Pseudomonas canavaninivorans]UVM73316.1 restriction endonuclease subunit S [Pseudomonas canavaninivorans]